MASVSLIKGVVRAGAGEREGLRAERGGVRVTWLEDKKSNGQTE